MQVPQEPNAAPEIVPHIVDIKNLKKEDFVDKKLIQDCKDLKLILNVDPEFNKPLMPGATYVDPSDGDIFIYLGIHKDTGKLQWKNFTDDVGSIKAAKTVADATGCMQFIEWFGGGLPAAPAPLEFSIDIMPGFITLTDYMADFTIIANDSPEPIKVHKCIMGLRSSYFRAMFDGGFKENGEQKTVIAAPHRLVNCMIQLIYGRKISTILNVSEINQLLSLIAMYAHEFLKTYVEQINAFSDASPLQRLQMFTGHLKNPEVAKYINAAKIREEFTKLPIDELLKGDQEVSEDVFEVCMQYRPVDTLELLLPGQQEFTPEYKKYICEVVTTILKQPSIEWPVGDLINIKRKYSAEWLIFSF